MAVAYGLNDPSVKITETPFALYDMQGGVKKKKKKKKKKKTGLSSLSMLNEEINVAPSQTTQDDSLLP